MPGKYGGRKKSGGKRKTGVKRKSYGKKKTFSKKSKTASQIVLSGQRLVDMEVRRNMQLEVTDIKRLFTGSYDAATGEFTGGGDGAFMANQIYEPFLVSGEATPSLPPRAAPGGLSQT